MKRINQINQTKKDIHDAFIRLLKLGQYDEISFAEIADEANISRMSVYRHFETKDAIIMFGLYEEIKIAFETMEALQDPCLYDLLIIRFRQLKESSYTELLVKQGKFKELTSRFDLKSCQQFGRVLSKCEEPYVESFLLGGIDSITEDWLQNGMKEPYELISQHIANMAKFLDKSL